MKKARSIFFLALALLLTQGLHAQSEAVDPASPPATESIPERSAGAGVPDVAAATAKPQQSVALEGRTEALRQSAALPDFADAGVCTVITDLVRQYCLQSPGGAGCGQPAE